MIYHFDDYLLDTQSFELRRGDEGVPVEPQVFSLLVYLIENGDRVVSKEELVEAIWDGRAISDGALNSRINAARRSVGDSGEAQAIIKTFPRRGFRFVGQLSEEPTTDIKASFLASLPDKPSIAVLPFANLSHDPEQDFFSDGITEDLITALSRIRRFRVIARGSTFSYKGQAVDVRRVASELGSRYVIEGSVRKAGNRVRLTVQLIDGVSGQHVWAERYDRELEDIFALQDELAIAIVGAVEPAISRSEQDRARRKSFENLDAWEAYHRGMSYFYKRTKDDIAAAKSLFLRAISIDPQFALAHAGFARMYYYGVLLGATERDSGPALKAARCAVELDPDEPEAHLALGMVHFADRDMDSAIPEFEAAIKLNPSYAEGYHQLGNALVHSGRPKDALPYLLTAIELSPKDPQNGPFHARVALAHLYLRQHKEAVEWGHKAVRLPGIQWLAHCFLVSSLAHLNRTDEAQNALDDLLAFQPGITLKFVQDNFPGSRSDGFDHVVDGLRKAGFPE